MDLNKTLSEWNNMLRKEGFNAFPFTDKEEIILLEIPTKNFKATIWKEKGRLLLFIPFLGSVEKEIKDSLESNFIKIAENKIKKLCSTNSKLIDSSKIKPWPLYLEHESIGMSIDVSKVEDILDLLKKFDDVYEKTNPCL